MNSHYSNSHHGFPPHLHPRDRYNSNYSEWRREPKDFRRDRHHHSSN